MSTRRRFIPALLLLGGFTASACTAILVPDEDDDLVVRCNNSEDCPDLDDNRYRSQCVHAEDQPENTDKVCVPDFAAEVYCGEEEYDETHPLSIAFDEAQDAKAAYGQCSEENRGKNGCQPAEGGVCNDGLEINNDTGACYDPDAPIPALYPPSVGGIDIAGQDAMDQFCRWYFCDESFVCDRTGSRPACRPCSGRSVDDYGTGACGQIYIQGEPSSFYTNLDNANCDGDRPHTEVMFGPAPTVP